MNSRKLCQIDRITLDRKQQHNALIMALSWFGTEKLPTCAQNVDQSNCEKSNEFIAKPFMEMPTARRWPLIGTKFAFLWAGSGKM